MRILVTGSSGFIGSHLVPRLASVGHEVVGLDLNEPLDPSGLVNFVRGDIRRTEDVRASLSTGIDCVVNLAAKHYDFGITEEEYWDYNLNGSRCLLDGMSEAGVSQYLLYSTIAVYGERLCALCSEETETEPDTPYGQSKLAAEELARAWREEDAQRDVVILRPCVVYGPRNFTNTFNLIKQIDSGLFVQCGNGSAVKAMAYVENLVRATEILLTPRSGRLEVFNYSDEPEVMVADLVDRIYSHLGKSSPPLRMPLWAGIGVGALFDLASTLTGKNFGVSAARVRKLEVPVRVDSSKIRGYGFTQSTGLDEALRRTIDWYVASFRNNPDPPVNRPY